MKRFALPRPAACRPAAVLLLLTIYQATATAGPSPLDANAHAFDVPYISDFRDDFVDLDATLPWKARFKPDGTFDAAYRLGAAPGALAPAIEQETTALNADGPDGDFDARGTVVDIRHDAGKLKIEHGPIASLDMPGMTMLFNVDDPALLGSVQSGDEIDFDVEYSQAGMVITRIRRAGEKP